MFTSVCHVLFTCGRDVFYCWYHGMEFDRSLMFLLIQIVILVTMPVLKESASLDAKMLMMYIVPRLVRIIPLYLEVTSSAGIIAETAWAGAAFNLFLYMLACKSCKLRFPSSFLFLGRFWIFLFCFKYFLQMHLPLF